MVSASKLDSGISARVKMTIQNIKEIVGNHSDADIYVALKEANMDPNETTQNLLQQDPFHEVKRKKDRKKEVLVVHKDTVDTRNTMDTRKSTEHAGQGIRPNFHSNQGARRGGYSYTRNRIPGMNRTYRVKENRINENASKETKPSALQSPTLNSDQVDANAIEKGSSGNHQNQRQFVPRGSSASGLSGSVRDVTNSNGTQKEEVFEEKRVVVSSSVSGSQALKTSGSQLRSGPASSSSSVVGVYSSSSDPVHVPSPDSRSSGAVGAIKREVGVVGARRLPFENASKDASVAENSSSDSNIGRGSSSDTFRPFSAISKSDQLSRTVVSDSVMPAGQGNRSFLNNQYGSRLHHQVVSHPKATQQTKEWKPKSSQKSNTSNPGVIGAPKKSNSLPSDGAGDVDKETEKLQDKLLEVNIHENDNVIIAQHIRVPENDRCRLTFGSFGLEFDSSRNLVPDAKTGVGADLTREPSTSLSVSVPVVPLDNTIGAKPADIQEHVQNSESESPESGSASELQLPDKKDASSPQNLDSYADIDLVQESSPPYAPSEAQLRQDNPGLQGFSSYSNQTGYDISYFRPTMDERGQGLPSPQENLVSHGVNGITSSSISMVQQQQPQPPVATIYPQVHVPHFGGVMPYRPVYSPFFVPQVMPGYSGNPAYAHPSNGGNFVIMPGGSSQLATNGLKYGIPQLKPVPGGSASGFGNFANSTGYAINSSGVIGNASGLEDSSRLKYKDGNLYVANQQADTSDLWISNGRDMNPGLQSGAYYNMAGQTPHGAYMSAHTGHTPFNAAAAQSSHMQFQGLYHSPPQAGAMASPHHLGPAMGGNVVAPAAPGAQMGSYQQPQLGHLNWTTNF